MRFVQKYYSIAELAWTLSFSESSIRAWARAGEFGPRSEFLERGSDTRIPTSGVLFFIERNLARHSASRDDANRLKGRTLGEARRRLQVLEAKTPEG